MANPGSPVPNQRESSRDGAVPMGVVVTVVVFILILIALTTVGLMDQSLRGSVIIAGALVLALLPVSVIIAMRSRTSLDNVERRLLEMASAVNTMTQEGGMSEGAKRVLHRRQEREILRRAIEQDIATEDWDAAMVLVKELAERFGYRGDAEEFRSRIERARAQTYDRDVIESLQTLDDCIRGRHWTEAYAEAARLMRIYPDSHRTADLRERVDEARVRYRKDLERRFLVAAQREQVEEAMTLLKELDIYLTPTEAGPFQEVARGVIGKSRENLGVRFKLMVHDHNWSGALEAGDQIVLQFPNSRMAQEVRDLLPVLREKATMQTARA